jgi:hypothetical protein
VLVFIRRRRTRELGGQQFTRQALYYRIAGISKRVLGKRVQRYPRHPADQRHAEIDSTQRYLGISMTFLRTAYYKFHPRAKGADDERIN